MSEDFSRLRLKYHGDAEQMHSILQMECRYKCAKKLSKTLLSDGFVFPSLALAEMSTSDDVADIHAAMANGSERVLDMTAGLGIDTFHFAEKGCDITAIELSDEAVEALRHNVATLGLGNKIRIIKGDSVKWLMDNDNEYFDIIFIDPARRDSAGRHFVLSECIPDVTAIAPFLLAHCKRLIIKASPMADIEATKRELGIASCRVTVIGTNRECKEVVFEISDNCAVDTIICTTVGHGEYTSDHSGIVTYGIPAAGRYLLQPYPAVMKGTGGVVTGYDKLHANTHLYVSDTICSKFPGTHYRIAEIIPFNKAGIRMIREKYHKLNIVTRNFPLSAPDLVKKLKIQEGGDRMLFGATLRDGSKTLIITESAVRTV